jgi:hypothetical protein
LPVFAPASNPNYMTLFSLKHFWEFLNGQILCCGLSLFFICILVAKALIKKTALLPEHFFLLATTVLLLVLVFVANLQRGSGDWDIMAFTAITANSLLYLLAVHLLQKNTSNYLLQVILVVNFSQAILWVDIQHGDKSVKKIENMLTRDPASYYSERISGEIQLALLFRNNRLYRDSKRIALDVCLKSEKEDVLTCLVYAEILRDSKRIEEACAFYEDLLRNRTPYIHDAYIFLLGYYDKEGQPDKVLYYLNLLFDSFTQNSIAFTSNLHFKKSTFIGLFEALQEVEKQNKNNSERLQLLADVIKYLKENKNLRDNE